MSWIFTLFSPVPGENSRVTDRRLVDLHIGDPLTMDVYVLAPQNQNQKRSVVRAHSKKLAMSNGHSDIARSMQDVSEYINEDIGKVLLQPGSLCLVSMSIPWCITLKAHSCEFWARFQGATTMPSTLAPSDHHGKHIRTYQ